MSDDKRPDAPIPDETNSTPTDGDRIAKVMARAGVASRREAERMIIEGRVKVNGEAISSPALDVTPSDRVTVDGKPLDAPQPTRLWAYYKPVGLVTSEADEKGRQTIFDALPRDLPRVMTVGRLDLNSEGLLLLTNDGALKRRLELPSTGWLRRYRVRVNGTPTNASFDPLRDGVTIDGEDFQPMEIRLDSQQGVNAWLSVGIREGRNREIRRAMAHIGLQVNRLIRTGYGPFRLAEMEKNEVREIRRRVLREQLGGLLTGDDDAPRKPRHRGGPRDESRDEMGAREERRDGGYRQDGDRKPYGRRDDDRPSRGGPGGRGKSFGGGREDGDRKPYGRRDDDRPSRGGPGGRGKSFGGGREDGDRKPYGRRDDDRPSRGGPGGRGKSFGGGREDGDRKPYGRRDDDRPSRGGPGGRGKSFGGGREDGDRKPYGRRDDDRPSRGGPGGRGKSFGGGREDGDRKPYGRRDDDRPSRGGPGGGGKSFGGGGREDGDRKPYGRRDDDRPSRGGPGGRGKSFGGGREDGDRKPYGRRDDRDGPRQRNDGKGFSGPRGAGPKGPRRPGPGGPRKGPGGPRGGRD